jgi:hypothetical protein
VSHDRRLLETICDRLWVVDDALAVPFDGGYRAWRAAVSDGWSPDAAAESEARRLHGGQVPGTGGARSPRTVTAAAATAVTVPPARSAVASAAVASPARRTARPKLSKDQYRRQRAAVDAELTRLGLRKNHLELALGDPVVSANFVELRRVTSELADVEVALGAAEEAWLELEERAP